MRILLMLMIVVISQPVWAQCGSPDAGSCCELHLNPYCDDAECCATVCAILPACCNSWWDSTCAFIAQNFCISLCGSCGSGGENCCSPHETPYCSDASCCQSVCAILPHCCDLEWDEACADAAAKLCRDVPGCGPPSCPGEGDCCAEHDTPFCADPKCCETVCAIQPLCCTAEWRQECAELAWTHCDHLKFCGTTSCVGYCGGMAPGGCWCDDKCIFFGDCCPGVCDDDACCHLVTCKGCSPTNTCLGQCGEQSWYGCWCDDRCDDFGDCCPDRCADCPQVCPPIPGDLDGDGVVGPLDLMILASQWGPCPPPEESACVADLNGDGRVDVLDVLILLANWG